MKIPEWLAENKKRKFKNNLDMLEACIRETGRQRDSARKALKEAGFKVENKGGGRPPRDYNVHSPLPAATSFSNTSSAQPLTSLLAEVDDIGKVKTKIKEIGNSKYIYDEDLRRELRVSPERWRIVSQHPSFKKNRFLLPNRKVVWVSEKGAEILDKTINLHF